MTKPNPISVAIKQREKEARDFERSLRMSTVWPSFYTTNKSKPCLEAQHNLQVICKRNKCSGAEFLAWYLSSYHDIPSDLMAIRMFGGLRFANLSDSPTLHIEVRSTLCVGYRDKRLCYKYGHPTRRFGAELNRLFDFFHKQAVRCVKKELANAKTVIALAEVFDIPHDLKITATARTTAKKAD